MQFYFQGIWRMDWGLGNPNKTGALIAVLMIAVWVLPSIRRWAFWVALPLFTGLGVCLMHTFSRGGVIAACMGAAILLWRAPRPWPTARVIAIIVSIWMIIGASMYLDAAKRFGQGLEQEDKSITNRLEIWKVVPKMMVDAPDGWGLGNSGRSYMQWYQPLERNEEYRTLVSSHLTWLVEFGWPQRVLYILGWTGVLVLCFPRKRGSWIVVPFAVWATFCVAAFFSSVAESIWLWIVPGLLALSVLIARIYRKDWLRPVQWLLPPAVVAAVLAGIVVAAAVRKDIPIIQRNGFTKIGAGEPKVWILATPAVFGSKPPRALREYLANVKQDAAIAYTEEAQAIQDSVTGTLILGGELKEQDIGEVKRLIEKSDQIVLLNPAVFPAEIGQIRDPSARVRAVFGEFSQSPAATAWQQYLGSSSKRLEGVGDFLPNWPELSIKASL